MTLINQMSHEERLEMAKEIVELRWKDHPNPQHEDAIKGLEHYVAAYSDITLDDASLVVARFLRGSHGKGDRTCQE